MGEKNGTLLPAVRQVESLTAIANALANSDLLPMNLQKKPANVLLVLMHGQEVGLSPVQAIQSIYPVGQRTALYGDGFLAVLVGSKEYDGHEETFEGEFPKDDFKAVCVMRRKGAKKAFRAEFSIADAKQAGLWEKRGKTGQPTPWVTYPKRMLQMRARTFCGRDAFPDVLKGLTTVEEARDIEPPQPSSAYRQIDVEDVTPPKEAAVLPEPAVLYVPTNQELAECLQEWRQHFECMDLSQLRAALYPSGIASVREADASQKRGIVRRIRDDYREREGEGSLPPVIARMYRAVMAGGEE